MNKDNNTFTVAASSLDYSNLIVGSDSCVISNHKIPLEKVNGVIDRFEEETKARKKDIDDLKFFTEISKEAICQSFDSNIDLIKEEIKKLKTYVDVEHEVAITKSITTCRKEFDENLKIIRKQFYICVSIFGSLTLFLLFGFIYCIINL